MRETEARKALQEKASAAERAQATENEVNRELEEVRPAQANSQEEPGRGGGGVSQHHQNKRRKQLLQMLKDPEKLKTTVVAAEILKTKYF